MSKPGLENRVNDEQKEGKYGVYNNRILSCLDSWACMPFCYVIITAKSVLYQDLFLTKTLKKTIPQVSFEL